MYLGPTLSAFLSEQWLNLKRRCQTSNCNIAKILDKELDSFAPQKTTLNFHNRQFKQTSSDDGDSASSKKISTIFHSQSSLTTSSSTYESSDVKNKITKQDIINYYTEIVIEKRVNKSCACKPVVDNKEMCTNSTCTLYEHKPAQAVHSTSQHAQPKHIFKFPACRDYNMTSDRKHASTSYSRERAHECKEAFVTTDHAQLVNSTNQTSKNNITDPKQPCACCKELLSALNKPEVVKTPSLCVPKDFKKIMKDKELVTEFDYSSCSSGNQCTCKHLKNTKSAEKHGLIAHGEEICVQQFDPKPTRKVCFPRYFKKLLKHKSYSEYDFSVCNAGDQCKCKRYNTLKGIKAGYIQPGEAMCVQRKGKSSSSSTSQRSEQKRQAKERKKAEKRRKKAEKARRKAEKKRLKQLHKYSSSDCPRSVEGNKCVIRSDDECVVQCDYHTKPVQTSPILTAEKDAQALPRVPSKKSLHTSTESHMILACGENRHANAAVQNSTCKCGCCARNTIVIPPSRNAEVPAGEVESLRLLIKLQAKDNRRQFDMINNEIYQQRDELRKLTDMFQTVNNTSAKTMPSVRNCRCGNGQTSAKPSVKSTVGNSHTGSLNSRPNSVQFAGGSTPSKASSRFPACPEIRMVECVPNIANYGVPKNEKDELNRSKQSTLSQPDSLEQKISPPALNDSEVIVGPDIDDTNDVETLFESNNSIEAPPQDETIIATDDVVKVRDHKEQQTSPEPTWKDNLMGWIKNFECRERISICASKTKKSIFETQWIKRRGTATK